MSNWVNLVLHEDSDEVIVAELTALPGSSLLDIEALEFVMKQGACAPDSDPYSLTLSTTAGGVSIVAQSSGSLTAEIAVPAAALADPYERAWRLDALTGTSRRTALHGYITVTNT